MFRSRSRLRTLRQGSSLRRRSHPGTLVPEGKGTSVPGTHATPSDLADLAVGLQSEIADSATQTRQYTDQRIQLHLESLHAPPGPTDPPIPEPQAGTAFLSATPDRASPVEIPHELILSGPVHIFYEPLAEVARVTFQLGNYQHTEHVAPYDLAGTTPQGAASPFDTTQLPDGAAQLIVTGIHPDGSTEIRDVGVVIDNGTAPAPPPPPEPPQGVLVPNNATRQFFADRPGGTRYLFAGEYNNLIRIVHKPGNSYVGDLVMAPSGVVLVTPHGELVQRWVRQSGTAKFNYTGSEFGGVFAQEYAEVEFTGVEVTGYRHYRRAEDGTILGDPGGRQKGALSVGPDSVVSHIWVHDNWGTGVRVQRGIMLHSFDISFNSAIGIGGGFGRGHVHHGSLLGNTTDLFTNTGWEAGGCKLVHSSIDMDHVYAALNRGTGLWYDIDNRDFVIEYCVSEFNTEVGIRHEIGGAAKLRYNLARYNGETFTTQLWGAQIMAQNAWDVEIHDNETYARNGADGIAVVNQCPRCQEDSTLGHKRNADNYDVHHNIMTMESAGGQIGVVGRMNLTVPGHWDENTIRAPQEWWNRNNFEDSAIVRFDEWKARTGHSTNDTVIVI